MEFVVMTGRCLALVLTICVAGCCVVACGGSAGQQGASEASRDARQRTTVSGPPGAKVAPIPVDAAVVVGSRPITKATLNRWMAPMVGGDFYERLGVKAPKGLVSEPPDYSACHTAVRSLGSKLPSAQIASKCRQLYQQIKEQVLTYLIEAELSRDRDAEAGVTVSNREVEQELKRLEAQYFSKEGSLQKYLTDRNWPLWVELFLIKRDLLFTKLERRFKDTGQEKAFGRFMMETNKRWSAKTSCRAGYVVQLCNSYVSVPSSTSPDLLLEEFANSK